MTETSPSRPPAGASDSNSNSNGALPAPQAKAAPARAPPTPNQSPHTCVGDDIADHVDFKKLLQPSSSEYYYSDANRVNRQLLDKMGSMKSSFLDLSAHVGLPRHSRASMLSERLKASSYRGPAPLKRDGSFVRSAMRRGSTAVTLGLSASADSLASAEAGSDAPRKRCSFACVDIREYERVAGDNPCVSRGVPLSIGWGYCQHESIALNEYEFNRGPPRDKIEMMVPSDIRKQILQDEFGVSIDEMNAAMREVTITKKHRKHTDGVEPFEGLTEVAQSAKRKFKRLVKGTSTAKEQEAMWHQAQQNALKEY